MFSPDGDWLLFVDQNYLKKLHVDGGEPVEICEGMGFGICWTPKDTIYYCRRISSGIWKIPVSGGDPEQVTKVAEGEFAHWSPEVLPGGQGMIFTVWKTSLKDISTALLDFKTGMYRTIIKGGADARWVPTGHLVFIRQGTLMAVPFDLDTRVVSGSEVPVIQHISQEPDVGLGSYSFSLTGLMIYQREAEETRKLIWVDQQGNRESIPAPPADYGFLRLSPDEKYLSYNKTHNGENNIWLMELETGKTRQLTFESENFAARWHPDGSKIAFTSYRNGPFSIYEMPIDRSQPEQPLVVKEVDISVESYTPDGNSLLATIYAPESDYGSDILLIPLADPSNSRILVDAPGEQNYPEVHPDGNWIAYHSNESGRWEVFMTQLRDPGRTIQVSIDGGKWGDWSDDGKTIFYWNINKLMSVTVSFEPQVSVGTPHELFELDNIISHALSSDGRFIISVAEHTREPQIVAVTNWFEELKQLTGNDD